MKRLFCFPILVALIVGLSLCSNPSQIQAQEPAPEDRAKLEQQLQELQKQIKDLKQNPKIKKSLLADVEVYAKAAEWILRHNEFYKPQYVKDTFQILETGQKRAQQLQVGKPEWTQQTGTVIFGYYSKIDGSVQPYALTFPADFKEKSSHRWPLHVELHGRGGKRNEVFFITRPNGRGPRKDHDWLHLDPFGRTDNGWRWSGDVDVHEAIDDVKKRHLIDKKRITLRGFSMGGAGAWHLGLHYPSLWCGVGPGAGFVDFYQYQNYKEKLPHYQHKTLRIYDSIDYALNAADVPVVTYGGGKDKQLVSSTRMVEKAKDRDIEIPLYISPEAAHQSRMPAYQDFLADLLEYSKQGRPAWPGRKQIRFITYTPKFNECEWLTIEELDEMYEPTIVEGGIDDESGNLQLTTENVAALSLARNIAAKVELDGTLLPLESAANGLLPQVYYVKSNSGWDVLKYEDSKTFIENPNLRKRHNLQGPIDDAFTLPFVCVTGTGTPWQPELNSWSKSVLTLFEKEFDKWLRAKVPVINDTQVTDKIIADKNLILFGDPGSNALIAKVVEDLPIEWTKDQITVNGKSYDTKNHGIALIYPNPLNPARYVVINSGHTMHEKDFRASNSWLFPKLGDIAVIQFKQSKDGTSDNETVWAELFDSNWKLP
ncbi:prolyl oligopeptidase family serine peptidase [Gimesia fumaroli]|uniref:Prolyl oligopeptidase family protein n=1 Tax=Gimesia fumaroli TaxID=2527976 RepID=A0A518I6B7_9PLAN|nr:prolyl oligopeptidase family serine peptidase [Gimesia fumaroli]QDV48599.1 Prolyl oligopeptidase family protein [Gimesia fumaroli]